MKSEVEILKGKIRKIYDFLGEFRYYTEPTEQQNAENTDIVAKACEMLGDIIGDEEDE